MLLHLVTPKLPPDLDGLGNFALASLLKNLKQNGLMPKKCIVEPSRWLKVPDVEWLSNAEIGQESLNLAKALSAAARPEAVVFDLRRVHGLLAVDVCKHLYYAVVCGLDAKVLVSDQDRVLLKRLNCEKEQDIFTNMDDCCKALQKLPRQRA